MQADARCRVRVVGKFGTSVEFDKGIVLPSSDHLEPAGREQRTESNAEGEISRLFELPAREMGARVVATVGSINDYDKSRHRRLRRRLR